MIVFTVNKIHELLSTNNKINNKNLCTEGLQLQLKIRAGISLLRLRLQIQSKMQHFSFVCKIFIKSIFVSIVMQTRVTRFFIVLYFSLAV